MSEWEIYTSAHSPVWYGVGVGVSTNEWERMDWNGVTGPNLRNLHTSEGILTNKRSLRKLSWNRNSCPYMGKPIQVEMDGVCDAMHT
jgi:hypothetical protein